MKILDGKPIASIAFDNNGTAWIGTIKQGIVKYKSGSVTYYNSSNSDFQDTAIIRDIKVDSKGNVWIGGYGITKYDGNRFVTYNSKNSPIPVDWVTSIAIDSKDNIWFNSCRGGEGGLVKYDGKNWTIYNPDNSPMPVNFVQSIAIDKFDNIYLALQENVFHATIGKISKDNTWTFITNTDLGFNPFWFGNIVINNDNELCGSIDYLIYPVPVETLPGPQVFIYNGATTTQLKFDDNPLSTKAISVDKDNNIRCFGYSGSYSIYNGIKWSVDYSSFEDIFAIVQTPDNKIWFGTGTGIVIK
jgi:ligand-binding sensor domain-containing protein